jgi:hypothetical protein
VRSDTFITSGLSRKLTISNPLCASRYVGLEAARKIGEALVVRGLSQTAEPTSFFEDELKEYYGLYVRSLFLFLVCSSNDSLLRCPDSRSLLFLCFVDAPRQANFAGTNSQAKGDRSRQLGWSPKHDRASFLRSLDKEVETIWREEF